MTHTRIKNDGGYVAILAVLMIAIAGLALAVTFSLLGLGELQSSLALSKGEGALQFVEGCTEDALLKVRASDTYAGGTITRPEGTCTVNASKAGSVWTLTVSTADTTYVRTVRVVATKATNLTITSWKEL